MDFCRDYLGLGRISPKKSTTSKSSTTAYVEPPTVATGPSDFDKSRSLSSTILTHTMLARTLDTPAYANLTTSFLQNTFNPMTPDSPQVEYYSFGAVIPTEQSGETGLPIWHPLYLPHKVVTEREGRDNDGLVSLKSARWGKFVGKLACDHWVSPSIIPHFPFQQKSLFSNLFLAKIFPLPLPNDSMLFIIASFHGQAYSQDLRNGAIAAIAEKKRSKGFDTFELWRGLSTFLYKEGF